MLLLLFCAGAKPTHLGILGELEVVVGQGRGDGLILHQLISREGAGGDQVEEGGGKGIGLLATCGRRGACHGGGLVSDAWVSEHAASTALASMALVVPQ